MGLARLVMNWAITFISLLILVALIRVMVVSISLMFLFAPIAFGFYLGKFFIQKNLSSYFIFIATTNVVVGCFVVHHYWDLNIWLVGMALTEMKLKLKGILKI